jgi:hypothetical protein
MKDLIEVDEQHIARIPKIGTTMARKIKKDTIKFMKGDRNIPLSY